MRTESYKNISLEFQMIPRPLPPPLFEYLIIFNDSRKNLLRGTVSKRAAPRTSLSVKYYGASLVKLCQVSLYTCTDTGDCYHRLAHLFFSDVWLDRHKAVSRCQVEPPRVPSGWTGNVGGSAGCIGFLQDDLFPFDLNLARLVENWLVYGRLTLRTRVLWRGRRYSCRYDFHVSSQNMMYNGEQKGWDTFLDQF